MKAVYILISCLMGTFMFQIPGNANITSTPQAALLICSVMALWGIYLIRMSGMVSFLVIVASMMILRGILLVKAPILASLDYAIQIFIATVLYYVVRRLNFQEKDLKWFLIPSIINVVFVFIQKFATETVPLRGTEICGLLGNGGLTGTFLGMTTILYFRYFKLGLPFLLMAIVLCGGFVGMIAFMATALFYFISRDDFLGLMAILSLTAIILGSSVAGDQFKHDARFRLSMAAGTASGCFYHPIVGWGPGSFLSIISQVKPEDSEYFGVQFNSPKRIMNHPHNEFLYGWWNFGALFLIGMIAYSRRIWIKFRPDKIQSFCILLSGFIVMMLYFFKPPTAFLMAVALGIFENKEVFNHG